jgi:hypothetical protein
MNLSEITQKVLRLVETRSGIPAHVEPDPNLPGTALAKVVMLSLISPQVRQAIWAFGFMRNFSSIVFDDT